MRLYEALARDLEARPPLKSVEIFLGDYIDRGPRSRDVLEWLIASSPAAAQRICLMGNHEAMLLDALDDPAEADLWLGNGGVETIQSYGAGAARWALRGGLSSAWATFLGALPDRHQRFLRGLSRTAEFGDYLFVHAGVNPERRLADQDPHDLIWIREPFLSSHAAFGKVVVHGHTPVAEPDIRPNRINIDTGAVFTGRLTCLVLEGPTRRFLQAIST
jgi:serine/threonine protein phosphatase 1